MKSACSAAASCQLLPLLSQPRPCHCLRVRGLVPSCYCQATASLLLLTPAGSASPHADDGEAFSFPRLLSWLTRRRHGIHKLHLYAGEDGAGLWLEQAAAGVRLLAPTLEQLVLTGDAIGEEPAMRLVMPLAGATHLERLYVDLAYSEDPEPVQLPALPSLSRLSSLQDLFWRLSDCRPPPGISASLTALTSITAHNASVAQWAPVLEPLTQLKALFISGADVPPGGRLDFLTGLTGLQQLGCSYVRHLHGLPAGLTALSR